MDVAPADVGRAVSFEIIPNPAYAGKEPTLIKAACHDGTPCLTVAPGCGHESHLHESQIELAAAAGAESLMVRCTACSIVDVMDVQQIREAFKQMRDDGWIA